MDEQYKKSLYAAKSCNEDLSQLIEKTKSEDLKKDLERLNKFIKYAKTADSEKYFNFFEVLNMGEDTISQLLAFLLDVNWLTKINDEKEKQEKMISYDFCLEFFKLIREKEQEYINRLKTNINYESDLNKREKLKERIKQLKVISEIENLEEFVWNIEAIPNVNLIQGQKNYIDIFLHTIDNSFTCVIENKKLADISYTNDAQIIRYKNDLKKTYPKSNKKFILICGDYNYINQNLPEHTSKRGKEKEQVPNIKISDILEENQYTVIDHRDIIIVLYKILRKWCPDSFFEEYKILKPSSFDDMQKMISNLCEKDFINKNKSYDAIQEILENNKIQNINEFLNYDNHILPILKQKNKRISGNMKIKFYDRLNEKFDLKERLEVFCRYIEYWELHRSIGTGKDNLPGETKIVDGKCIYQVCKDIQDKYNNSEIFNELPEQVKKIIAEYTSI